MQAIRNMEPAWEKVNGLKFQLKQRTISQHGRKYVGANLRWLNTETKRGSFAPATP